MTHLVRVLIFCILRLFLGVYALEPEISCNDLIVGEGESLTCQCKAKTSPGTALPNPGPLLLWPGHSNTYVLTVDSVRREDNGKIFTCVMVQQGVANKTATHTLLVAYGPSSDDPQISCDHPSLVTDGTKKFTLTCEANHTYPTPQFSWGGICASNTNSCTCQPRINEDGSKVFCTAINSVTDLHSTTSYTLTLRYPPTEAPQIVADTNKTVLSSGDKLTCTIRGGKPVITSVNFYCTNPILPDQLDLVGENSSVSSSIIVDTTGAAETPTVCHCSAVWEPDPSLYQNSTSQEFLLEFKATVTSFTVNGTTKLTVTEDEEPSVVFYCEAAARPTAEVSLLHGNKTRLAFSRATNVSGLNHSRTLYKLSSVRCEDTGVFVCEADNGLSTPSKKSVHLDVLGGPRLSTIRNNTDQTPELTENGMVITLVANPVPHAFHCGYLSLQTEELDDCHPDIKFKAGCEQQTSMTFLATCSVHPVNVPEQYLGFYSLSISNGLGNYTLSFEVRQAVRSPNKQDPWMDGEFSTYAIVVSGLMGVTLLVVLAVIFVSISAGWKCRATTADSPGTAGVEDGKDNAGYMSGVRATQPEVCQPTGCHVTSSTNNKTSETGDSQPKTTSFTESPTAVPEDVQRTRNHVTSLTEIKKPEMLDATPTSKDAMPFADIMRLNGKYEAKYGEEIRDDVPDGVC